MGRRMAEFTMRVKRSQDAAPSCPMRPFVWVRHEETGKFVAPLKEKTYMPRLDPQYYGEGDDG